MKRWSMGQRSRRAILSAVAVVLGAGGPAAAFDAQQFAPAVDPNGIFSVYSSKVAPQGRFHVGVWHNWADDPVVLGPGGGSGQGGILDLLRGGESPQRSSLGNFPVEDLERRTRIVDQIHTFDLVLSYSLLDWLELGVLFPVSDADSEDPSLIYDKAGIDDIRLFSKVQIFDPDAYWVGMAVMPFVELPGKHKRRLTLNSETDFGVVGIADLIYERFRGAVNFGYRSNDDPFDDEDESDEIVFGAGFGLLAFRDVDILFGLFQDVEALFEVFGSTATVDAFEEFSTPLEGLGGVRLYNRHGFDVTAGIGESITDSINGAAVRVVSAIRYTPPPPAPAPPPPPPAPPPPAETPEGVVVTDEQIVTLEPIYFDFDKATIKPVSLAILDQVALVMRDRPSMVVRVEGHTDSFGSDAYNELLSERRAHAVVRHLIGKQVEADRLQAVGHGETRPIATNDTARGRARNRRTEFHIVSGGRGVDVANP